MVRIARIAIALAGFLLLALAAAWFLMAPAGSPDPEPGAGAPADGIGQFTPIDPPRPAPGTEFFDASGAALTLADFEGRVVLVNFWATWCAPCIEEMPALDRLQAMLGGDDFLVLAVNEDRGGAAVAQPFLEKLGIGNLDLYVDEGMALARALGVAALPTSLLIGRDGRIAGQLVGIAEWDSEAALALIRGYMEPAAR